MTHHVSRFMHKRHQDLACRVRSPPVRKYARHLLRGCWDRQCSLAGTVRARFGCSIQSRRARSTENTTVASPGRPFTIRIEAATEDCHSAASYGHRPGEHGPEEFLKLILEAIITSKEYVFLLMRVGQCQCCVHRLYGCSAVRIQGTPRGKLTLQAS